MMCNDSNLKQRQLWSLKAFASKFSSALQEAPGLLLRVQQVSLSLVSSSWLLSSLHVTAESALLFSKEMKWLMWCVRDAELVVGT